MRWLQLLVIINSAQYDTGTWKNRYTHFFSALSQVTFPFSLTYIMTYLVTRMPFARSVRVAASVYSPPNGQQPRPIILPRVGIPEVPAGPRTPSGMGLPRPPARLAVYGPGRPRGTDPGCSAARPFAFGLSSPIAGIDFRSADLVREEGRPILIGGGY